MRALPTQLAYPAYGPAPTESRAAPYSGGVVSKLLYGVGKYVAQLSFTASDWDLVTPDTTRLRNGACPCLSGDQYDDCCARFHRGDADAPTAEQLMRSRYSAFVVLDPAYLLRTWHASTRPQSMDLDEDMQWRRLDILSTDKGGPLDNSGTVEFAAHYRLDGERGVQREASRFVREGKRWFYVDGDVR
ncbi:SEC-C motif-containing protein [Arthrobacter sp. UNCCL28]|nr:SEC-C motif-containing protein [Arthrobacter sp. UNCCL28]